MLDTLLRDSRLAIRSLGRTPGFAATAILTLGIGMGGTALMLTASNAAFREPLAFGGADRLVHIWQVSGRSNQIAVPLPVARDWEGSMHSFERMGLSLGVGSVNVIGEAGAERAVGALVSRSFFETLGVTPSLGRGFSEEEAATNGPAAVVISDRFWERMFGRRPDVLSRVLRIEGVPHPIVGVMPRGFAYPLNTDLWSTFERNGPAAYGDRTSHNFEAIARLAPGVTLAQAHDELQRVTRQLHEADASMKSEGYGVRLSDLRADLLDTGRTALLLLTGAVACVLLIACANVANLLLARTVTREGQSTLRVALGATRADLLRVFLVESVVLAAAGTIAGAVLVVWSSSILDGLVPPGLASVRVIPDPLVLALCGGLMLLVGVLCGLPSALHSAGLDLRASLSSGGRSLAREPKGMRVLTAVEVAIACVLLIGAGLLLRSLARLEIIDPGFRAERVVVSPFSLGAADGSAYDDPLRRAQFLDRALARIRAVPGVEHAGVTSSLPFTFSPNALLEEEGMPPGQWGQAPSTHYRVIGGAFFEALQIRLEAGRFFDGGDRGGAPHVAIVNQTASRQMWNGERPLGRRVRMANVDGVTEFATVVGVVADVRHRGLTVPPVAEVYFPYAQRPRRTFGTAVVVRAALEPEGLIPALRSAVRETDASVPSAFALLQDRVDVLIAPARFRTRLLAAFSLVALGLAAIGLFAVISYAVARRTREIGIRMALGADARRVQRLVIARGMVPVAIGTVAGAWTALWLAHLVSGLVFEITPRDPLAFGSALVVLPAVAFVAAWLPARRATRIDPTAALRAE